MAAFCWYRVEPVVNKLPVLLQVLEGAKQWGKTLQLPTIGAFGNIRQRLLDF